MFAGSVEIDESGDFGVPLWMMAVFIIGTTLAVVYVPRIVGVDAAGGHPPWLLPCNAAEKVLRMGDVRIAIRVGKAHCVSPRVRWSAML